MNCGLVGQTGAAGEKMYDKILLKNKLVGKDSRHECKQSDYDTNSKYRKKDGTLVKFKTEKRIRRDRKTCFR